MKQFYGEEIPYCYDDELKVEVKLCCGNCEFCFHRINSDGSVDRVCAGRFYGQVIEDLDNWYCDDFGISFDSYMEEVKNK